MRTTLTLDDDLARELQEKAHRERRPFKDVVNEALRSGLGHRSPADQQPFVVQAEHRGFRPGIDPRRLNQLGDDLETDEFIGESSQ